MALGKKHFSKEHKQQQMHIEFDEDELEALDKMDDDVFFEKQVTGNMDDVVAKEKVSIYEKFKKANIKTKKTSVKHIDTLGDLIFDSAFIVHVPRIQRNIKSFINKLK